MPSPWCGQVLHSRCSCKCFPSVGRTQKRLPSSFFTRLGVKLFSWELPPDFCPSKGARDSVTASARAVCDGLGTLSPGQAVWGGHRMSPGGAGTLRREWDSGWGCGSGRGLHSFIRGSGAQSCFGEPCLWLWDAWKCTQSFQHPHPSAPQRSCASHFSRSSALRSALPDFLGKGANKENSLHLGVCILGWRLVGSSFFFSSLPHY